MQDNLQIKSQEKINEFNSIKLQNELVASLLSANKPSKLVIEYYSILHDEFLPFINKQAFFKEDASVILKLQNIGEQLKLIGAYPEFYKKHVVAIAGGFSAGKSAFINSLIKDKDMHLATDINPTTAIPTYVLNGNKSVKAVSSYGGVVDLSKIDPNSHLNLSHQFISQFGFNLKSIMPQVFLSTPIDYEHICFIDTPGYDPASVSGSFTSEDKDTASSFAQQSDTILWVIGLDANGTIPKTDIDFLLSLMTETAKPIYVVLNKADIKPSSQIKEIIEEVKESLDNYGIDIEGISAYSSLEHREVAYSGQSLFDYLKHLNHVSDKQDEIIKQLYDIDMMYQYAILKEKKLNKEIGHKFNNFSLSLLTKDIDLGEQLQEDFSEIESLSVKNSQDYRELLQDLNKVTNHLKVAIEKIFNKHSKLKRVIVDENIDISIPYKSNSFNYRDEDVFLSYFFKKNYIKISVFLKIWTCKIILFIFYILSYLKPFIEFLIKKIKAYFKRIIEMLMVKVNNYFKSHKEELSDYLKSVREKLNDNWKSFIETLKRTFK